MTKKGSVYLLSAACVLGVLLLACPQEKVNGEKEPEPEEAKLFVDLALAAPLKSYSHHNPVMTQNFGADPNVLEWDGRLYLYMTADSLTGTSQPPSGQSGPNDYGYIKSLRVLSTADMVNWTQHPEITISGIGGTSSYISNLWAPALAVKNDGASRKIFLYFSNSGGGTGVISADHPLGPWTSPRSSNLITGSTPNMSGVPNPFDPAVLVDDNGRAYLYVGGGTPPGGNVNDFTSNHPNPDNIRAVELNADMISLNGAPVRITLPFTFEASEINKINGRYYYSYSSNPQVNHYATRPEQFPAAVVLGDTMSIGYAISDDPLGPYTLQGAVLYNPGRMFSLPYNNNHHKIFMFKGKWFIAYHSKLLMAALNNVAGMSIDLNERNYRSVNIDAVTVREDGTIDLVTGTRNGVAQLGSFNPYRTVSAATMGVMAGISTAEYQPETGQRAMKVTNIDSGDWLALYGVNFGSPGAKKFSCRVTPPQNGFGVIQIRQDSLDGKPVGYAVINPGQEEITVDLLSTVTGMRDLVFVFYGSGYDFEEWRFFN